MKGVNSSLTFKRHVDTLTIGKTGIFSLAGLVSPRGYGKYLTKDDTDSNRIKIDLLKVQDKVSDALDLGISSASNNV